MTTLSVRRRHPVLRGLAVGALVLVGVIVGWLAFLWFAAPHDDGRLRPGETVTMRPTVVCELNGAEVLVAINDADSGVQSASVQVWQDDDRTSAALASGQTLTVPGWGGLTVTAIQTWDVEDAHVGPNGEVTLRYDR